MTFSSNRIVRNGFPEPDLNTSRALPKEAAHRIRRRIQIQIPSKYAREPVISTLTTRYGLDVNILSALLATNSSESGWFDLELNGIPDRIQGAMTYLNQLHIEILTDDAAAQKSWSFQ
jgi:ABC-type methionine transport system ATPase subunit